ncbi:uncharacterized protein LOC108936696 isoform X1 [Scleropages formosus]|uniref:uncharacterized protein LOC108936696 isoform X1 n=2 Tax=Scleropages formosus TaxID=113540 RepID=UPI0010FAB07E|nr:uncharacterized protein LOC108936696 isoform X1 [Scleropages formosus]
MTENLTLKYMERAGRLSVGRDCSLHIYNVSTEDGGRYTCRIGQADITEAYVSVLTIRPQRMADGTMNLQCLLYTYDGPGRCHKVPFHKVSLKWLSDTGTEMQTDVRHQQHKSPCNITLTVKLKETSNREWTCQLLNESKAKGSHSYSISESSQDPHKFVIAGTVAAVALVMIISVCLLLLVKFRRRAGDRPCRSKSVNNCSRSADGQRDTDGNLDSPNNQYETVNETSENTLTYTEVLCEPSRQKQRCKQEGENNEFCTEYVTIKIAQT